MNHLVFVARLINRKCTELEILFRLVYGLVIMVLNIIWKLQKHC